MLFTEYELWSQDGLDMFELSEMPEYIYKAAIDNGKKYLNYDWDVLTAAMYTCLERERFFEAYRARRIALSCLALAEYTEKKGRFFEDIINGIWCICEESTWALPDGSGNLRDVEMPKFDAGAADTAALLTLCTHLFRKDLPLAVKKRVALETKTRVLSPFRSVQKISQRALAQTLIACIFSEQDEEQRRAVVDKTLSILDIFLNEYAQERLSVKNEESLYNHAAYIFDILEMLYNVTDQKFSVYSDENVRKAAEYIYKAHIGSGGFSERTTEEDGARVYAFGKRMDYRKLMDFGASEFLKLEDKTLPQATNLFHKLYSVKFASEISAYGDNFDEQECGYIDSMELFVKKTKGFSAAIKGGQSCAGNFLLYLDNEPFVVDLEKSHNLPVINGFTAFSNTKKAVTEVTDNGLCVDLSKTYPQGAGVISWMRSIEAEEKYVVITDDYELSQNDDLRLVMLMKNKPILSGDRILSGSASIVWEGNMALRVELVKSKTYDYIYRLIFHVRDNEIKGRIRIALIKQ